MVEIKILLSVLIMCCSSAPMELMVRTNGVNGPHQWSWWSAPMVLWAKHITKAHWSESNQ